MQGNEKRAAALNIEDITSELTRVHTCRLIRRHIQESKRNNAQTAVMLNVDQRTLESWTRGETGPKLFHFLRLIMLLGDSFLNEVIELIGRTGAYTIAGNKVTSQKLLTEVLTAAQDISLALEDGQIDHREWAILKPILKKAASDIDAFCAAQDAKS